MKTITNITKPKTDRKAQTANARAARAISEGLTSQEITIVAPDELMAQIKAMTSRQRGEAIERGTIEFPWDELDRLQKFEAKVIENARIILGESH